LTQAKLLANTSMIASAHNNIGLIHWNTEHLDSALIHYRISEKFFAEVDQRRGLTSTMNNIGLIYNSMFRFDDAIKYFKKVLNVAIADSSKYLEGVAYQNLAISFNRDPLYDSAVYYLDKAIPIQKEINNNWGLAKSYHSRGSVKTRLKQMDEAVDDFNNAIAINKRLNNLNALASNYFRLSVVYPYFENYSLSKIYVDSALMLCPQIDDLDLCKKVDQRHALLSVRDFDVGLYERLKRTIGISDSQYTAKLEGRILELQEQYEAEKKEQELQIQNLKIAEQEQAALQRERLIWGLIILVLMLILFGFLFVRYRSKLSKLKTQQRLAAEHSRISRDLHDNIGAQLTAMSTRIDLLDDGKNHAGELEQIRDEATATVSVLRDTIWAMHREEFTVAQFMSRVRQYVNRVLPESIKLDLEADKKLDKEHLNSTEALNLFRIAQEAIQNCMKHSDASSSINIRLKRKRERFEFLISDDGKGCLLMDETGEASYGL